MLMIDPPPRLSIYPLLSIFRPGEVADESHRRAGPRQFDDGFVQRVSRSRADAEMHPFVRERMSHRAPQPAAGARYHRDFPGQTQIHLEAPCCASTNPNPLPEAADAHEAELRDPRRTHRRDSAG